MTSRQLYEWELMYARWHMGDSPHERDDVSAAIIAQTVAAVNMKKPPKIEAFIPTFNDGDPVQQSPDELRTRMLQLANRRKGAKRGNDQ